MIKDEILNEVIVNKQGLKMWVKEYRGSRDIDVEFENGFVAQNTEYRRFKSQSILCKDKTGIIGKNKNGSQMTIIKDMGKDGLEVLFENGYKTISNWTLFKSGSISNPLDKTVENVGFLGIGDYVASIKGKHTPAYSRWKGIIKRCYNKKCLETNPTYKGCIVSEEWHNFQNFAKWFYNNYYEIENRTMSVDKDILLKGNKVYSESTCIIVPDFINNLFIKSDAARGSLPIGVSKYKNKYIATIQKNGKNISLGTFDTPEEAFDAYKKCKEEYMKEVADKFKDKIPQKLYDAMYKYEVEITD